MSFTRDFAVTEVVPALDQTTFDASCNGGGGNTWNGKVIDRFALQYRYNAAMPLLVAQQDIGTSTGLSKYAALAVKLQHANTTSTSATGATGWSDLTTGYQSCEQPLVNITSPASSAGGPESTAAASTSTGQGTGASKGSFYPIDLADRYLRIVAMPHLEGSSSGGSALQFSGSIIFSEPAYAQIGSPIQSCNLGGAANVSTSTGIAVRSTS